MVEGKITRQNWLVKRIRTNVRLQDPTMSLIFKPGEMVDRKIPPFLPNFNKLDRFYHFVTGLFPWRYFWRFWSGRPGSNRRRPAWEFSNCRARTSFNPRREESVSALELSAHLGRPPSSMELPWRECFPRNNWRSLPLPVC